MTTFAKSMLLVMLLSPVALAESAQSPAPALIVTPSERVMFYGPQGGPIYPAFFQYRVSATAGSLNYAIQTPSWLTAGISYGTTDATGRTVFVLISKSASDLKPGTYGPGVSFINTTNGKGSVTRPAVLVIAPREPIANDRSR